MRIHRIIVLLAFTALLGACSGETWSSLRSGPIYQQEGITNNG
jgi:hypothetical protein